MALEADYLATGHYARVDCVAGAYRLRQAVDGYKDQSYVLHTLRQEQLARVLFPIGEYTKDQVRQLARDHGLAVASKRESQDLCFLKDGDYRRFLREYSAAVPPSGPILDASGRELGHHEGLPFYTIGQRKGLGLAAAEPLFVLGKDAGRNALIVGPREALGASELTASSVNWIGGTAPARPIAAQVKIRYKATPIEAVVFPLEGDGARVEFAEPAFGVTPGQAAVFYDGEVCLGGGLITGELRGNLPDLAVLRDEAIDK
jgi:tRNA-specific 2-thiouridylase